MLHSDNPDYSKSGLALNLTMGSDRLRPPTDHLVPPGLHFHVRQPAAVLLLWPHQLANNVLFPQSTVPALFSATHFPEDFLSVRYGNPCTCKWLPLGAFSA